MGDFKTVRHLNIDNLSNFMLLDDDFNTEGYQLFNEKFEPFFGNQSSIILEDNTLHDIAFTLLREGVDFKLKEVVTGNEQERVLRVMGLIADYCCWTTFTQ